MRASPYLSVLITSYNREKYICTSIESVLSQSFTNYELIIVDDCSSDNTIQLIQQYAVIDTRIRVFQNDTNLGQFENRNKAASYARGDYIVYLDSDDTFKKDALQYISDNLNAFSGVAFATIYKSPIAYNVVLLSPFEIIKRHFFDHSVLHIGPGGTIIKRDLFLKIGGFPIIYGPAGDMYYNIKIASCSDTLLLNYDYVNYRRHAHQEINDSYSYIYNGYRYFSDIMNFVDLPLSLDHRLYLSKKNKRRFIVNTFNYFIKTFNLMKTIKLFNLAKFSTKDFVQGCLH